MRAPKGYKMAKNAVNFFLKSLRRFLSHSLSPPPAAGPLSLCRARCLSILKCVRTNKIFDPNHIHHLVCCILVLDLVGLLAGGSLYGMGYAESCESACGKDALSMHARVPYRTRVHEIRIRSAKGTIRASCKSKGEG